MKKCFDTSNILLPDTGKANVSMDKWAVIACDQFTSQPEYWEAVCETVGDAPSMLSLVLPEVYLAESEERVPVIHGTMKKYLEEGIFTSEEQDSFILVERITESGIRLGLVGQIDLEQYDFNKGSQSLIRATEETVISRIPPRVKVRLNAPLESPHVMLLMDAPKMDIIEPLYEELKNTTPIYDIQLMQGGGSLKGFAVSEHQAKEIADKLDALEACCGGLLYAVGDGNHSLATAKTCWEEIKKELSPEEAQTHPARYALVELCNLHSDALQFEPIHRVLFDVDMDDFMAYLKEELSKQSLSLGEGKDFRIYNTSTRESYEIIGKMDRLPIEIIQKIIDSYLALHTEGEVDYIHGEKDLEEIVETRAGIGILLQTIEKSTLFPAIRVGGVLPRKTFSIGHAHEKRYYMECRKIR